MKNTQLKTMLAAMALALPGLGANADTLKPREAKLLHLGDYQAVVYYEDTLRGREVVTTLRSTSRGDGVRYISTLAPGETQSLLIDSANPKQIQFAHTTRGLSIDVVNAENPGR